MSTRHLSPCPNVNNEVVNFCDETLESDVTKNDLNVAVDSGENINETPGETNLKKYIIILFEQNVRWSNGCNKGVPSARRSVNY